MRLPLPSPMVRILLENNCSGTVFAAHTTLRGTGYTFVGWHGTSERAVESILAHGFDPTFAGSSAGLDRGIGLYVSRYFKLADEFSDTATQAGDQDPITFAVPTKHGLGGISAMLRVYVRNFRDLRHGIDYVSGPMIMRGWNRNQNHAQNQNQILRQQEIVFRPRVYERLVAIPTTATIERELFGQHNTDNIQSGVRLGTQEFSW